VEQVVVEDKQVKQEFKVVVLVPLEKQLNQIVIS
jgi:hypothetical protein